MLRHPVDGTALGVAAVLAACGALAAGCAIPTPPTVGHGDVHVVADFYPVAEAAERVGGDLVTVTDLTPAGVEPHDIELTSVDLDTILDADVALYVGNGFQPAVEAAVTQRDGPSVDIAAGLLVAAEGRSHGTLDPHFWLDPVLMVRAVDAVLAALIDADPAHADELRANAARYTDELAAVDADYRAGLAGCARHEIVTAHAAFAYLARRYGLTQVSITGASPDAEPDPQRLADLIERIHGDGITTVFFEALLPPDLARTLADEAGVRTAVLDPLEGLTDDQVAAGDDYASVMRTNLAALEAALGCGAT